MEFSPTASSARSAAASLAGCPAADAPSARLSRAASVAAAGGSVLALFLLAHPYRGITHDGLIYIGRALADADPGGLGRDILFAHDEQSRFSLYPWLVAVLVGAFGPSAAAMLLSLAGLLGWLAAAAAFSRGLADGRLRLACLAAVSVLPAGYGGFAVFRYAEPFATPRPLAEACVLAGLAAIAAGRWRWATAAVAAACLLHPLMAMPGLGVFLLVRFAVAWRRLAAIPLAMLGCVLLASLAGPASGLATIDPLWRGALDANAYLFPTLWPAESWMRVAVQAVTVASALPYCAPALRTLLGAVLAAGALGLAAALAGSAGEPLLLAVQLQPWRALWLVAATAALVLPVAALGLWRSGPSGRIGLAFLLAAWLPVEAVWLTGAALSASATLSVLAGRIRREIDPRLVFAAWAAVACIAAGLWSERAVAAAELLAARPPGATMLTEISALGLLAIPAVAAIAVAILSGRPGLRPGGALALAGGLAVVALSFWDDRSVFARRADLRVPDPALTGLLSDGPGEILWVRNGALQAWALAGRPSWASYMQGAAMVFSRPLAAVWTNRMDRLAAAGLADGSDREPHGRHRPEVLRPAAHDLAALCAAPDGPAAIVLPDDGSIRLPASLRWRSYTSPVPEHRLEVRDGRIGWAAAARFAVLDCRLPAP